MKNKAIELIRVSTAGQAEDDRAGIPAQRAINRRTAAAYNLEIVRTIELTDVSGTAVLRSPEMQELLRLIESPDIDGVVAREFSRLMRPERFEDFILLQAFADTHTMLYLPEGPLDLSTKAGSFMGGIRALMAGWERREIIDRMQSAKEEMRRAGKHPGGSHTLPFGVGYDGGKWFYTPDAEKIRQAYNLVRTTMLPYAEIARRLNLPRTSLRCMLQNPIYTGMRVIDHKRDQSAAAYIPGPDGRQGYRKKIKRAPDEIISLRVMDGLVPDDVFESVQAILNSRAARERDVRCRNAPQYLFNGFLYCARCDEPMYSHRNQKAGYYYCKRNGTRARQRDPHGSCSTPYIMAAKIEPKIEELFAERLQDESTLTDIAATIERSRRVSISRPDADAVSRKLQQLADKRARVLDSFCDGVIDRQQRDERLAKVDAEIDAYHGMQGEAAIPRGITAQSLADVLAVFTELPYLQRDDKRALLRAAGAQVFVDGYKIRSVGLRNIPRGSSNTDNRSRMAVCASREHPCR